MKKKLSNLMLMACTIMSLSTATFATESQSSEISSSTSIPASHTHSLSAIDTTIQPLNNIKDSNTQQSKAIIPIKDIDGYMNYGDVIIKVTVYGAGTYLGLLNNYLGIPATIIRNGSYYEYYFNCGALAKGDYQFKMFFHPYGSTIEYSQPYYFRIV